MKLGEKTNNKELFFIGEIAKAMGITRKIILNHEAKGLITPDKKDGIALSGIIRNVYLEGPPQHKDKTKFITQIIAVTE